MPYVLANTIYAGTSGGAVYQFSGKLPSDGWTSFVVLRHSLTQKVYTLATTIVGESFRLDFTSADSALWEVGEYRVYYYVEKAGEKVVCYESVTHITPDPQGGVVKSADQLELEALDKAIAGVLAGEGVQNYSFETAVGRRSAERMSLAELRQHKGYLEKRIRSAEAKASGRPDPHGYRRVAAKFNR